MRKLLVILALSAATVAASAEDAFGQGLLGQGIFRRRAGYGNGSFGNGYYGNGYYGNGYYGNGIGTGYYGSGSYGNGIGTGYYNNGYYGPTTGYSSMPSYNTQQYYSAAPINQGSQIQQSGYFGPTMSQTAASVTVMVPRVDAKVWFDGSLTSQQGMQRTFHSPSLATGSTYTYTVRASWTEDGKTVERERNVNVQPGQSVTVDFRNSSAENLQTSPRPQ